MKKFVLFSVFLFLFVGLTVFAKESANTVVSQYERAVSDYETWVDRVVRNKAVTDADLTKLYEIQTRINVAAAKLQNPNLLDDYTDRHFQKVNNCQTRLQIAHAKIEGLQRSLQ